MASWLNGIADATFRAVPGGYVFKSPSPWLFGRPNYYLVNDPQKAAIREFIRKRSCFGVVFSILTVVGVLILATILMISFGTAIAPVVEVVVIPALLFPLMIVPHLYFMRMLQPIIKDLPKTDQRFPIGLQFSQLASAMPQWLVYTGMIGGLFVVFAGIFVMYELMSEGRLAGGWISLALGVTCGAFLAGYFAYAAILKKTLKSS